MNAVPLPTGHRRRWDLPVLVLVLALLAGALWLNRAGLADVLATLDWSWAWPVAFALFAVQMAVTGARSIVLLGASLPARPVVRLAALRCHALAQASNTLLPSMAGDVVVKAGCLNGLTGLGWGRLSGLMLVDRGIDVAVAAAIAPVALLYLSGAIGLAAAIALAAMALIAAPVLIGAVLDRLPIATATETLAPVAGAGAGDPIAGAAPGDPIAGRAMPGASITNGAASDRLVLEERDRSARPHPRASRGAKIMVGLRALGTLYRRARHRLLGAYGVTLLRYALYGGVLVALSRAILDGTEGGAPAIAVMALGVALAQLALAVPLAPGGIGLQEGAWVAILTAAGHPLPDALAFAVAFRLFLLTATTLTTVPIMMWRPSNLG